MSRKATGRGKHLLPIILTITLGLTSVNLAMGGEAGSHLVIKPAAYKPQAAGPLSKEGKRELDKHMCATCHSIQGKGGCLAPPFDGIGARRSKRFIQLRITDDTRSINEFEKVYPHPELLEHPRIPASHARSIAAYLLTLPEPAGGFAVAHHKTAAPKEKARPVELADNAKAIAAGRKVFNESGCMACHSLGNIGGQFAPRLDGISKRRNKNYIEERISESQLLTQRSPDEYQERGTAMPPMNLTAEQVAQVTAYLMSLPPSP